MDLDDVYGAPLEEFVPRRTALARELRNAGSREEAAAVAKLRKPSVAAWAVNQLVRTQARSVRELFDAGDDLQAAHNDAAAGRGDAGALRESTQRERAAADSLIEAARGLLTSEGHELSATVLDRVAETLRAAALDPEARASVQEGRLERELRQVGLGFGGDLAAPGPEPKRTARSPQKRTEGRADEDQKRRAEQEQAEREQAEREQAERERAQARKAARAAETEARRKLDRAQRSLDTASKRRDDAAQALERAEEALAQAEGEQRAAAREHERARQELERL